MLQLHVVRNCSNREAAMFEEDHDQQFVETILGSIADGVFTVDRDWRITSFNRAAERITGVEAAEALGRRCSEVLRADLCEHNCALRKTPDSGSEQIDVPARILDRRGRSVPISVRTAVLRDSSGELMGAVETFRDLSAIEHLRREIDHSYSFEDIVGKSEAFQRLFAMLPDIAQSDSTVLIEGPRGSGKELLARVVHNLGPRRSQPMVVVNCGKLPPSLFESELFGSVQGALTDAKHDKPGRIAMAEGGTIFFDEVSELPPDTGAKLLRVLEDREYEPLEAVKSKRANVRVVAATNKKLADLVTQGRFREDLYYRLAVVRISVPPLRERREDIPLLIEHFIDRFNAKRGKHIAGVTPAAMERLMRHDYAGNVRELENIIELGFVLCHDRLIDVKHLPEELQAEARSMAEPPQRSAVSRLMVAEAEAIRATLRRNGGHLGRTANDLEISRATLWRKMKKHGIDASEFRVRSSPSRSQSS